MNGLSVEDRGQRVGRVRSAECGVLGVGNGEPSTTNYERPTPNIQHRTTDKEPEPPEGGTTNARDCARHERQTSNVKSQMVRTSGVACLPAGRGLWPRANEGSPWFRVSPPCQQAGVSGWWRKLIPRRNQFTVFGFVKRPTSNIEHRTTDKEPEPPEGGTTNARDCARYKRQTSNVELVKPDG